MQTQLTLRHLLLALTAVLIWGLNFVVIKYALGDLPPLLFALLRFTFAALPFVFFMRHPQVPWYNVAAYGVLIGVGQFGSLYIAMQNDITPGLASLIVQLHAFFTMALAMLQNGDRPQRFQIVASAIALSGMCVVGMYTDGSTTLWGLFLAVFAAFSWGCANVVGRQATLYAQASGQPINMLAYVIWSSLYAVPPLLLLSLGMEGWPRMQQGVAHADWATWAAVFYQSWGNTIVGYGIWAWLLGRYAAASISPLALLVPVVGMASATAFMQEPLPAWKLIAATLVLLGLTINVTWPLVRTWWMRRT